MGFSQFTHGIEQRPQRFAERRDAVDHARRRVGIDVSCHDPGAPKFSQLFGERFFA
jgi:hypothetical protein